MRRFSLKVFARNWHRRFMWLVGLQLLLWSATGLFMVSIDIHDIHGDRVFASPQPLNMQQVLLSPSQIINLIDYSEQEISFNQISLRMLPIVSSSQPLLSSASPDTKHQPVYVVSFNGNSRMNQQFMATNGEPLAALTSTQIVKLAQAQLHPKYRSTSIKQVQYLTQLPSEVAPQHAPALQIVLDTWDHLTLYVNPESGKIVTVRHDLWRIFDRAWRLHITDYDDGENHHNWFLQLLASISLVSLVLGTITLSFRLKNRRNHHSQGLSQHNLHKWLASFMLIPLGIWIISGLILSVVHPESTTDIRSTPSTASPIIDSPLWDLQNVADTNIMGQPIEINLVYRLNQWLFEVVEESGFHRNLAAKQHLTLSNGMPFVVTEKHISDYVQKSAPQLGPVRTVSQFLPSWLTLPGYQNPIVRTSFTDNNETHYFDRNSAQWIKADTPINQFLQLMRTLHFMDYLNIGGFNHIWNLIFAALMLILSISGLTLLFKSTRPRRKL